MSESREFPLLSLQAQFLADLEGVRIANENRIRALKEMGYEGREVETAEQMGSVFAKAESLVEKDLRNALRQVSFYQWITGTVGLGDKQTARLLGVIGHPCWRYDQASEKYVPRTVGQLWSYCGYSVVDGHSPRRAKGEQAAYNTMARTRCFLIAESCIKQMHSPYRKVYDDARAKYAEATHNDKCVRCGPAKKPALAGSELSDGHKHARALRLVAKTMLRDLWLAAGEDFGEGDGAMKRAKSTGLAPRPVEEKRKAA